MVDVIRQIVRSEFNSSPPVDNYLSEDDIEVVYDRWDEGVDKFGWQEKIFMRGNITSITCDMVKQRDRRELVKIYGVRRASRMKEAVQGVA